MYRHTRKGHLGGVGDLKEAVFNSTKVLAACIQRGSPHLLQSLSQSVETINLRCPLNSSPHRSFFSAVEIIAGFFNWKKALLSSATI